MKTIREISAAATFSVRHPVLRAGKPMKACRFDGDDLDTTRHFGIYVGETLAGVASLFQHSNPKFNNQAQFQLRGMAVLDNHRKKGLGDALVRTAERSAKSRGGELIWFNARIAAVPFYEKLGYQKIGEMFDIGDIGAHFVMFKRIGA
jgi:GNAT superfamily N-acetyltransferase